MTLVLKDLVLETSTTTGTGTYNLAGPTAGFRSFSVAGSGAKVPYIVTDGTNFEIGVGTVTVGSPNTLARTTIRDSSNSGAAVNWGTGTRMIRLAQLAPFTNSKDENLNFVDFFGTGAGTANAHTLTLNPAPSAYTNGMMIAYRSTVLNTTAAVTVNVNALGAKNLKINGADPAIGQIKIGDLIVALYNSTNNTFEIVGGSSAFLALSGGNMSGAINEKITTIASAATPDIWTGTGNVIDYAGTVTATGFAAAPQAGARRTLVCAAACSFTNGANMLINGGANFTAAAGDLINVIAVTTTQFRLEPVKSNGQPVVVPSTITPWVAYTPTFTGWGTVSGVQMFSRRVGDTLHIRGKVTAGSPTATESRISLGFNGVDQPVGLTADSVKVPSLQPAGQLFGSNSSASTYPCMIEQNVAYITTGIQNSSTGGFAKQNGSGFIVAGATYAILAEVPITAW